MHRFWVMGASVVLLLIAILNQPADARHRHGIYQRSDHHVSVKVRHARKRMSDAGCKFTNEGREMCGPAFQRNREPVDDSGNRAYAAADQGTVIGARPDGCPHAYCGCGLRKYLGLADVRLNLASNWARLFPREPTPRPGLAAVRSGHVMYIEAAASNGEWLIRDYNSGGGMSRLHVRDLRGYVFVNPRG
jgi:hypothetical protein